MNSFKTEILSKICYTDLVYGRINKKLKLDLSNDKIEEMITKIIKETDETQFQKKGKNIYITNNQRNIRLTINSYTNRIITAAKSKILKINIMLTINQKEDILIPFNKIGDENWKENTRVILTAIADNWNNELKEPIFEQEITELENRLGTTLPASLELFYKAFGIADIGEQLQDFEDIGYIKDIWSDALQYGPEFDQEEERCLPYLISFSDYLGNGNMFCFHSETKEIYYYDQDTAPYLTKIFDTVDDYLKGCLIFAQSDLFGETKQEEVDKWTEEIVIDLLGRDVVKKWRY